MLSSLSSGVTGLENFQEQMDVIGNNIANVNTTGFKAGVVDFADAFSNTLQGAGVNPAIQVGTGVKISAIGSNWTQGALGNTGVSSNLAVSGNGFFEVKDTVSGQVYATRDGNFTVDANGYLVTDSGDRVQGYSDSSLSTLGDIKIDTTGSTSTAALQSYAVDAKGTINVTQADGTTFVRGQVLLQGFNDQSMLTTAGSNLYSNLAAAGPTTATAVAPGSNGLGFLQAGELESSNVDLSNEMANLITAQRAFEANSKIITTTNEVLQTLVNMKQS